MNSEPSRHCKASQQIDSTKLDEATTFADSLGRAIKTQATDSQGDVFVETHYDLLGRVERLTNPYRLGDTKYWSKTRYDVAGRAVETFAPAMDGEIATAATNNNSNLTSLGITSFGISNVTNYIGTVVSTKDASGRRGRSITNALGQLIRVDEPTGISASEDTDLGALATPVQATSYKYDVFGKMVEVTQGVQKRWFKYDALGRLLRVRQPEQEVNPNLATSGNPGNDAWTAGFTYDLLGNVLTATDANGTVITNAYDRAGRVTSRTYSNEPSGVSTPSVEFKYDGKGLTAPQNPNFAKGKLTKVSSTVSATEYQLFDSFGRVTQAAQITDGNTYTSRYTYSFSGALVEEEYPSGRKVTNKFEPDGDLAKVTSKKNPTSVNAPFVSNFSYTASGGISQMKLGNGRWETAKFNNRMQVTELGLGSSATDAGTWKTTYEYGELNTNGSVDTTKNTGNIARQTLSFNGLSHPLIQSYKYDALYRIKEAIETSNSVANWFQVWDYDRYGNRISFTQNIGGNPASVNPAIVTATNRFDETGTNFDYDLNGNLVRDADGKQFTFNGDNKQTIVKDANNNVIGRYFYDGEGKRVKKITNSETTIFVYSGGKLVAEYSTQISASPSISYTTTDHLGSPRVITDAVGQVSSRRDFLPFGEDLLVGVGSRTSANRYSSTTDGIRQKFTGYQKDTETSLDFAEARMYDNRFGRFTAVDPLLASGRSINPQTFNRFVYGGNNPILRSDPNGEDWYVAYDVKKNGRYAIYPTWCASDCASRGLEKRWGTEHSFKVGERTVNMNLPFVFQITSGPGRNSYIAIDPFSSDKTAPTTLEKAQAANRDFILRAYKNAAIAGMDEISLTFYFARKLAGIEANEDHDTYKIGSRFGQAYFWVSVGAAGGVGIAAGIAKIGEKKAGQLFGSLAKTFSKYPSCSGLCTKAADEALSAFKKAGIEGEIVRLTDSARAPNLFDASGKAVAQTGFHDVVKVGDRYFDALTQEAGLLNGATWEQYIKLWDPAIQWVKGTR